MDSQKSYLSFKCVCCGDLEMAFPILSLQTHRHTHKIHTSVHCMNSAHFACFSLFLFKCVSSFNPAGHEIHFSFVL